MILDCLEKLLRQEVLTEQEASAVMEEILSGQASPTQAAALLVALAMKDETEAELLGMARVLQDKTHQFHQYGPVEVGLSSSARRLLYGAVSDQRPAQPLATFPISTAAAFVVAGAGVHVLQQGLRSDNDLPDSAAVLEALGVRAQIPAENIAQGVAEVGLGFLFAPLTREAMDRVLFAEREIPVPTAFQLLLPLLNPGGAPALVVGVSSARMTEKVARVVAQLGVRRAFVVHGSDGLDLVTNTGPTTLVEVRDGKTSVSQIQPGDFGLPVVRLEDLAGGDASQCAERIRAVLAGEPGARRQVVLLNAAPAIVCGGKVGDLAEGVRLAAESIDSSRARQVLDRMAKCTRQTE